ncbi:MAG: MFS transporter, partial [Candidatus Obscuribacterales bacterium]|nr:MFS transporter [Candidatus Obscuribacterales bacterium]
MSTVSPESDTSKIAVCPPQQFVRDNVAWLAYLMIASYCFVAAALGPLMSFLKSDLHLSYGTAAMHFSLWSGGVVIAGALGDRNMRRFGKAKTVWLACLGLCIGIAVLFAAKIPAMSLAGSFICGICGSTMSQTLCTIVAERFKDLRAVALTETTIAASLCCSIAPLVVSLFSKSPLGWRSSLLLPIIAFASYFAYSRKTLDGEANIDHESAASASSTKLPKAYWLCWSLIFLSVAAEWSIVYWSADFMEKVLQLSKADAAANVSSFLAAMVTGRILGSRLAREAKTHTLLKAASIVSI